jgi:hypothetical protein
MSNATIYEDRYDVNVRGNYYFDSGSIGANIGGSTENDYSAFYMGVRGQRTLQDQMTTLDGGLSFSIDELTPTGGGSDGIVKSAEKDSVTVNGGLTYIVGPRTLIRGSANYKYSTGFLSDPYKKALILSVGNPTVPDSRPHTRHQVALMGQLRHHIEMLHATVHLDYRFGWDTWELTSHMVEASWFQNFWYDRIALIPFFRYYTQSGADFYNAIYPDFRSDGLYSSDYRLSPFGAISYGARVQARLEDMPGRLDWRVGVFYERYEADAGYAASNVTVVNPGLVQYHFIYGTLEVRF